MSTAKVLRTRREQLALDAAREECGLLSDFQFKVCRQDLQAEIQKLKDLLAEIEAELAEHEDADCSGDPPEYVPNWPMRLALRIRETLGNVWSATFPEESR